MIRLDKIDREIAEWEAEIERNREGFERWQRHVTKVTSEDAGLARDFLAAERFAFAEKQLRSCKAMLYCMPDE
jgi:hypothetical protein